MELIIISVIIATVAIYNTIICIICNKAKDEISDIIEESIGTDEYIELETRR